MTHNEHERQASDGSANLVDPIRARWIITGACLSRCSS